MMKAALSRGEALALSIVQKTAPQCLQDKQIYVFVHSADGVAGADDEVYLASMNRMTFRFFLT